MTATDPSARDSTRSALRTLLRQETVERFVADLAGRQYGVLSRTQALALGMTSSAVKRRVAAGVRISVFPGVYRMRSAPVTHRQMLLAAALWAGGVVSHTSAALLWGLDVDVDRRIEITVSRHHSPRSELMIVHRTLHLPDVDREQRHEIPVTSAARTVIDLAGSLDGEQLLAAVESGFRQGLYRASFLSWRLDQLGGTGRSGSGRLRALLNRRGKGAAALEYRLEVKTWRLLVASDLPKPTRQYPVRVGDQVYRLDFAWPEHLVAVECEGRATHGRATAFIPDRDRSGDLAGIGWRVIPVTWDAVTKRPGAVIERVRGALAAPTIVS